eukprot:TRINITY_DN108157_c0_g1_i1.p1 TRINITY_DN108157_c0_g1~~TRINITY_DN108157_c0_g1_i1.p1  ORF type:complete len:235 (-),score=33.51 TRINITY_DN108157_c0_g1_i1:28-657(-)
MDNFAANHAHWQHALNRERKARKRTTTVYYGAKGASQILAPKVAPSPTIEEVSKAIFDQTFRSNSTPVLATADNSAGGSSGRRSGLAQTRQRGRPPLGSASHGLLPTPGATKSSFRSGEKSRLQTGMSQSGGADGLLFFNNQRREKTPSMHSCASGFSGSSSLWLQVEKAVQEEVAKVVKPLQEQLQMEEQARKRAEDALQQLGGSPTP